MSKVYEEIINAAYDNWCEGENYCNQSTIQSEEYKDAESKIISAIGEEAYDSIVDYVLHVICDAENTGFEHGFRSGIEFMAGILMQSTKKEGAAS